MNRRSWYLHAWVCGHGFVEDAQARMKDVGYIVWVMLGWPIVAAIVAAFGAGLLPGSNGRVFLALFFVLVVGRWLVTMPRMPRR